MAEEQGQLILDHDESQTGGSTRLELHQDIDVAIRGGVTTQNRPKHREAPDAVAPAERRERFPVRNKVLSRHQDECYHVDRRAGPAET